MDPEPPSKNLRKIVEMRWKLCAPNCYLNMLGKLQKRVRRTVCPSLVAFYGTSAHCRNKANLIFFYRYFYGKCSCELAKLVPFPHSR